MNLDQIATKCFILALFIRDDGQRLLLGDGYYDFNQKLQHFQANTIANDVVEIQGDNGQLLAGQVMRSGAQKFEGYIGDATTNRQTIEQKRSDFMAFFRIKHFYKVIYIFPDGTAIQRQRGYLTDAPTIPEIFQKFPEYSVALNFEDANYYEYAEDEHGDEIYAHIAELALAGGATCGLIWDAIGAVTNGITWSGIQTAQGEYIQITNDLDIPAKLASVEMLGKAEQTTLPSDYQAVEYVEASATQYIDTGVQLGANDFAIETGVVPTADASYEQPFLSIWTSAYVYWNWFKTGQNLDCYTTGHHYINGGATTGTYYDLKLSRQGNIWSQSSNSDSDSWTFSPSSVNNTTLKLFNRGDLNGKTNAQLYYLRISVAGELVRNYVPCYRKSDNVTGLYDLVGGSFSPSATADSFTKGTDTASPSPTRPQDIKVVTGENVVKIVGKNLFDTEQAVTRFENFAGAVVNDWGTYADGIVTDTKSNGAHGFVGFAGFKPTLQEGQTYTLSAVVRLSGSNTGTGVRIGTGYSSSTAVNISSKDEWLPVSRTFTATAQEVSDSRITIQAWNTGNIIEIKDIQLELGSTATAYEPYQGQEFEVNLGKNLLDPSATLQGVWNNASNTTTCTFFTPIYTGESFTISNKDTATWRFSAGLTTNPTNNPAGTGSQISAWQTGASYTITAQSDGYLWVQLRKNANTAITPSDIPTDVFMVERGSSATSFAPYFTPIELAKIGNYQDRIYKEDSKWYIEKQVGKVVLDGSESWEGLEILTNTIGAYTRYDGVLQGTPCLSNYFVKRRTYEEDVVGISCRPYAASLISLRFSPSTLSAQTIAGIKTWLSTHPTTVYYALATPTTTEITNEALIAQLEALGASSLYIGVNNIGTETLNAVPTLKIEYYTEYTLDGAGYEWEPGGNTARTIVTVAGVDSAWPIWTIQGGAQNPTLTNITTGQTISWQGFVPEGQTLTINMAEMTADLAGANVFEYITGEWLRLAPGNNTLVYNAGSADKPSTLSWNGVLA